MTEAEKPYGLLSETSGIGGDAQSGTQRNLPPQAGFAGFRQGWHDFWIQPASSLAYGVGVFLSRRVPVWTLVAFGLRLHPLPGARRLHDRRAVPGHGLYEKSRALEEGRALDAREHAARPARAPGRRSSSPACCCAC